ncbi:MAG TPA: neutral/alkaline non-lysosomal ceramidase N-terminal domain-containing protein [Bryobacteraceae bacterium]|nr:neutral/alkaline non-lysosomal ceramidase N-terminal domain-containing protein [Bryobacteraceae bacterium]
MSISSLRAGVARRDITPPVTARLPLWGFAGRNAPATGALDCLYARALVLRAEQGSVALVTLDLGRTFDISMLEPLRNELQADAGFDAVLFTASHSHAGPDVRLRQFQSAPAEKWAQQALDEIRDAVLEANASATPVRIGFATGRSWIGNNRRFLRPDGSVQMIARDSPKFRNLPIDTSVRVARLDTADGNPLAVLVHHSCHPVTLGAQNLMYSADWPGAMLQTIEEQAPGSPLAFFIQGAPGDINLMEPLGGKSGESERLAIGRSIGEEAARVARSIQTANCGPLRIQCNTCDFTFVNRWDFDRFMRSLDSDFRPLAEIFLDGFARVLTARVNVIAIGDLWAWVTMPGEPFLAFQMRLAAESPIANSWMVGFTDGYLGYFPTIRAAAEGGYGADGLETWVELGAGERILDHALVTLYQMSGKLQDLPTRRM